MQVTLDIIYDLDLLKYTAGKNIRLNVVWRTQDLLIGSRFNL